MSVFSAASPFELYIYRHIRVIHVIKICLALVIAHLINSAFPVPYFTWTSVTIVIIMLTLPQVGGALEKSIQRIIGTCIGALYGIGILFITSNTWLIAFLAMLGIAFTAYQATRKMGYAYLVAGFTLIMVLDGGSLSLQEAYWRTGTILLGCVIALCVSLYVLPLKARNEWRWQLSESLKLMGQIWLAHLSPNVVKPLATKKLLKKVERAIQRQKSLLRSVVLESTPLRRHQGLLEELIVVQNRCLTILELIAQTRWENTDSANIIQHLFRAGFFGRELGHDLLTLSVYTAGKQRNLPDVRQQDLGQFKEKMQYVLQTEDEPFHLNAHGYAWLIYQASQQVELLLSLVRQLAELTTKLETLESSIDIGDHL